MYVNLNSFIFLISIVLACIIYLNMNNIVEGNDPEAKVDVASELENIEQLMKDNALRLSENPPTKNIMNDYVTKSKTNHDTLFNALNDIETKISDVTLANTGEYENLNQSIRSLEEKVNGATTTDIDEKIDEAKKAAENAKRMALAIHKLSKCDENKTRDTKCKDDAADEVKDKLQEVVNNSCMMRSAGVDSDNTDTTLLSKVADLLKDSKCAVGSTRVQNTTNNAISQQDLWNQQERSSSNNNNLYNDTLRTYHDTVNSMDTATTGVELSESCLTGIKTYQKDSTDDKKKKMYKTETYCNQCKAGTNQTEFESLSSDEYKNYVKEDNCREKYCDLEYDASNFNSNKWKCYKTRTDEEGIMHACRQCGSEVIYVPKTKRETNFANLNASMNTNVANGMHNMNMQQGMFGGPPNQAIMPNYIVNNQSFPMNQCNTGIQGYSQPINTNNYV